jgi:hypothetical protein
MIRIKLAEVAELDGLMTATDYKSFLDTVDGDG